MNEKYYSMAERMVDALKDAEAERQYELLCMTEPYKSKRFVEAFDMKMSELQANNEAAEKAAQSNIKSGEIPF